MEAEIPALPGQKIKGALSFVSATVNPETRTVTTRMNLPESSSTIQAGNAHYHDSDRWRRTAPGGACDAVVREGNEDCVFVQTAPNTYLLRPVSLGADLGDKRVLLDGLRRGERIIMDGAFHLNNERKRLALGSEEGA